LVGSSNLALDAYSSAPQLQISILYERV